MFILQKHRLLQPTKCIHVQVGCTRQLEWSELSKLLPCPSLFDRVCLPLATLLQIL